MGRKNWKEIVSQKGPGRKAKKQGDPELPAQLPRDVKKVESKVLGGRIKQRARKRASKTALTQTIKKGVKKTKRAVVKDYSGVPPPLKQVSLPHVSDAPSESGGADDTPSESGGADDTAAAKQQLELFSGRSDGNSGKKRRLFGSLYWLNQE